MLPETTDRHAAPGVDTDKRRNYLRCSLPAFLALMLGISLSAVLFQKARDVQFHELSDEFEHAADNHASVIISAINAKLQAMESIRSFYHGSEDVDRQEFGKFVEPYFRQSKGYHTLQWVALVQHSDRDQFETTLKSDGLESQRITERTPAGQLIGAGERDTYFPVAYNESDDESALVFGYDLGSDPELNKAMQQARDTGEITAAARVKLLNLAEEDYGVYIFAPIYQGGDIPDTLEARREQLQGFVAGVLHVHELMEAALLTIHYRSLDTHVFDNSSPDNRMLLHSHISSSHEHEHVTETAFKKPQYGQMNHKTKLTMAGRQWEIVSYPGPDFASSDRVYQPWIVLACGLLVTLLISAYFLTGIGRTVRIEQLVAKRTAQLTATNESLAHEMHEREKAQEQIHVREEHYKAIFTASVDGFLIVNTDGYIVDVNPATCRMYGYTREEMIDMPVKNIVSPESRGIFEDFQRTIAAGKVFTGEAIDLKKDGTTFIDEVRGIPFHYNGEPHALTVLRDITERKHTQQEKEKLLKLLSGSNAKLMRSNDKLGKSNKELEEFAYIASHDLQEPLRKVIAFGDRLKSKYADVLDETGTDYLTRMQDAAQRMSTLINDLLTYSRVTSKAKPFEDVDLEQIVREVLNDLEIRIEELGATVEVELLCGLKADPVQMRQLLQNLISNALKFHEPDKAPLVKIYTQTVQADDSEVLQIVVEDNGIGFDEQYKDRIFGMFQRLHGRHEYNGTGLGLAVCRKIADRHDIAITVNSTVGKGSKFILTPQAAKTLSESTSNC